MVLEVEIRKNINCSKDVALWIFLKCPMLFTMVTKNQILLMIITSFDSFKIDFSAKHFLL